MDIWEKRIEMETKFYEWGIVDSRVIALKVEGTSQSFLWSLCYNSVTLGLIKEENLVLGLMSRSWTVDFIHFYFLSFIWFFLSFYFLFSIFRTTQVRGYQSRCHISHKLIAKSQDWSQDLGEWSRRFWNEVMSFNIDNLMSYTWSFRVGCTVISTDHGYEYIR